METDYREYAERLWLRYPELHSMSREVMTAWLDKLLGDLLGADAIEYLVLGLGSLQRDNVMERDPEPKSGDDVLWR